MMGCLNWTRITWFFVFLEIFSAPICWGDTDPRDVNAINSLYGSLNNPPLPGWLPFGGDPCGHKWQGVQCVNANVTGLVLSGANLGGQLSADLGAFASIIQIDLSNNRIGGEMPSNLPATLQRFILSGNQLTGSIPDTLSSLGQLQDLLLNNNELTGVIPDAFQQLSGLVNLDLSENNLTGQLPASMGALSILTTLHLQKNQLTGTLNVLQDLPLTDLNIENNLFSGPIPDKLLSIPTFRGAGNPFNATVILSPPAISPTMSPTGAPSPESAPKDTGPSLLLPPHSESERTSPTPSKRTYRMAGVALGGVLILLLVVCILIALSCKRKKQARNVATSNEMYIHTEQKGNQKHGHYLQNPSHQAERVSKEAVERPVVRDGKDHGINNSVFRLESRQVLDFNKKTAFEKRHEDHKIDISSELELGSLVPPPPPPFSTTSGVSSVSDPFLPLMTSRRPAMGNLNSVNFFTIASLQQYTNSFSQENIIGDGTLSIVYKAELPSGKLLAVKKLDTAATLQSDKEFLDMVSNVFKLKHPNILELVGYCAEHRQWLLIYEYCANGTLHEALHMDGEIHENLSWNARMRLALQAARALEYLHEVCQPPVLHRNFKSTNILLDDDLIVRISGCGLASLLPPNSTTQLQGQGYGAPELELGGYTLHSDVYSFGVVMLELLTGRKSHDRSLPRGEQSLVRWVIPRLHDIDALSRMVDPSLKGAYPPKSLSRFADIISLCVQREPEFRPPMSEIVQNLLNITH